MYAAPRPPRAILFILLLATLAIPDTARAQGAGGPIDLQLFRPAIDSKGLITLNASQVLGHLDLSFGLIVNYAKDPFAVSKTNVPGVSGESLYAVEHLGTGSLQAALGLYGLFEVGVGMPFTFWSGDSDPDRDTGQGGINPNTGGVDAQGAGDLAFHLKGRILTTPKAPLGLALMATLTLPTGGDSTFLGEGRITLTPTIIVDRDLFRGRLRLTTNLGARLRLGGEDTWTDARRCKTQGSSFACGTGIVLQTRHRLQYGVGASFAVVPQRFDLLAELIGQVGLGGSSDVSRTAHELLVGLRLYLARSSYMTLGVGRGLRGGWATTNYSYGSPDIRAFLGFVFEPNIGDRDGDGLKDDVDRCPTRPEDFDGFEDEDGCPDEDNDRDDILDIDDKCPNEPEDKDGIEDNDGCPDPDVLDRDGDQIPDTLDKCPDDPEDRDGFEDKDGCPDPDNDRDGILDVDDQCPNEPETRNGYQDEDGCPDKLIRMGKGKIFVMKKIFFQTASAIIREESYPTLDAVAATLRENPQLLKIEIQGHADERGSDGYNLRLTTARAQSVRRYLIGKGIAPQRLDARGYGERQPRDRGHTPEAWAKNRRVEFVIKKRI